MSDKNIADLINHCLLPSFKNGNDRLCEESDFEDFRSKQVLRLVSLDIAAQNINLQLSTTNLKIILKALFLLLGENNKLFPWNNSNILDMCNKLKSNVLTNILQSSEKIVLEDGLIVKESLQLRPLFKDILIALRPKLLKETWKNYPAAIECFAWLLGIVEPSSLTGQISNVLPTALLLVDDYINENKIVGVNCISLILENMTIAELKYHGFGHLIYKALERVLREREESVARVVIPCILNLTSKLEENFGDAPALYQWSQMDDVMEILLEIIQVEHFVNLRKLYIGFMPRIVQSISSKVYRWTKRILMILDNYLEVAGTQKDFDVILDALKTFKVFLLCADATRNNYCDEASFLLLRTIYHIVDADIDDVKVTEILKQTREVLEILYDNLTDAVKIKFKTEVLEEVNQQYPGSKLSKVLDETISAL